MKPTTILGILLILFGVVALAYPGVGFTNREKIIEVGPIEATRETHKSIPIPPTSSRSICMNLREAWSKRRYPAHFISKLTDCDGELNESDTSLDFARDCGYINMDEHRMLSELGIEVGKMLGSMIRNPEPFLLVDSDS